MKVLERMQWSRPTFVVGFFNWVNFGNGNDTVTIQTQRSHDTIIGGQDIETIFLGENTCNRFKGGSGHHAYHLPAPPTSWHGTTAAFYHDTIINCTVVTP